MKTRSAITIILLGGGVVLSAIAALFGAVYLGLLFDVFFISPDYTVYFPSVIIPGLGLALLGLVLLVSGIIGLVRCVRRLKVTLSRTSGQGLAYLLIWPVALGVLAGIALMVKPISGGHLKIERLVGRENFEDSRLEGANLSGVDLSKANLSGANLRDTNLRGADLRGTNLSGADLRQAWLMDAKLDGHTQIDAKWRLVWELTTTGGADRDLHGVDLREANLHSADLSAANLEVADLSGAYLGYASFRGAKLHAAKFVGCNLFSADLSEADLSEADLSDALFWEADLSGVNLSGANLTGARGEMSEILAEAASLDDAIMPDGTKR